MFIYNEPVLMRTKLENILMGLDTIVLYALIIIFLIVTTEFTLRVENTFSNPYAPLSETRHITKQLSTVLTDCQTVSKFSVNFAPVDVNLNEESAPFTLAMITSLIAGILIIAAFQIIVGALAKGCVTYNIKYMRLKGIMFPLHTILALADVGLSVTIIAAIGASHTTRRFLGEYMNSCSDSLRASNMTLYIMSDIDTDVVYGTDLIPLMVVAAVNVLVYGIETIIKVYLAWDKAESALVKARYPYISNSIVATPIEPLLLEYTLLRAAKIEQLQKDPKNTNPLFMPILTGQYLDADGNNFTHEASICLDDVGDEELRKSIVHTMAMTSMGSGRELRVPRTFMAGADPKDPVAQQEFRNRKARQIAARKAQQQKAQEELDQQFRDARMRARNRGQMPPNTDITQQGQAWDPEEEGEDNFYDPNFPLPASQRRPNSPQLPRNNNFANTTVFTSDPYGISPSSQPVTPQLVPPGGSDKSAFYIPNLNSNQEGSSVNGATNNSISDAGLRGSMSAMNGGHNVFNNNLPRADDASTEDRETKRREKKAKKGRHHRHSSNNEAGRTSDEESEGATGQIFAYYDADGNLLGEGETLEGLDGEDYILEEYDENGNLISTNVNEDESDAHRHHSRSNSKERRHKEKKGKKDKRDKKDKKKDKKDKTETTSPAQSRSESAAVSSSVAQTAPQQTFKSPVLPAAATAIPAHSEGHPFLSTTSTVMGGGAVRSIPAPTLDEDDEEPVAPPPATSRLTAAQQSQ